jgi:hypothetical protein
MTVAFSDKLLVTTTRSYPQKSDRIQIMVTAAILNSYEMQLDFIVICTMDRAAISLGKRV